jgi:hypothetical protein
MKLTLTLALILLPAGLLLQAADPVAPASVAPGLRPVVEIEEDVYRYEPANNGAGPMWCSGSTCLVRVGDEVFASGLETLPEAKPLNNCRWVLFRRAAVGWQLQQADAVGRTREPCPLAVFPDGRLFLSANPTTQTDPAAAAGPARPEILQFSARAPKAAFTTLLPVWEGEPAFTEHSYRSFAADGPAQELILFQNIGYTHAEWAFRDREGRWAARGRLTWPWGAEYDKPQPIRVCYPNVALRNRAVHFCGVSDIAEPYQKWREFKRELTGREWDYDFRRFFYTWTPDIMTGKFQDWVEIASRDKTCGWVSPGDLWVGPDGAAHLLWTERALDERLRAKFFPEAKQSHALNYAVVREGKVALRRTLLEASEGSSQLSPSAGRFQVTPDHRLLVICHVSGADGAGKSIAENRVLELLPDGQTGATAAIPFARPFTSFFTATIRAGSVPSDRLELLGLRAGSAQVISYARVRLNLP